MAEASQIVVGQNVRFKGYSEEMDQPLLTPGEMVRVRAINPDGGLIIDMLDAQGNVRTDVSETDTLFPEEVEIITADEVLTNDADAGTAQGEGGDGFTEATADELAQQEGRPVADPVENLPVVNATMKPAELKAIAKAESVDVRGLKASKALADAIVAKRAKDAKAKSVEAEAAQAPVTTEEPQTAETPAPAATDAAPATEKPKSGKGKAQGITPVAGRAAEMAQPSANDMTETGPRSELVRQALAAVGDEDMAEGSAALIAAKTLVNRVDETYYTLGGVLAYIKETGVYKSLGFDGKRGFADYCKGELGTDYRKAQYLIDVYEKVQAAGLNELRLREIGWSKAVQIVRVGDVSLEKLAEDFDELVDFAGSHNRDELISHIQTNYEVARRGTGAGTENGDQVAVSTFIFKLAADAATSAERALQHAKAQTGSEDLSEAFKYICDDWSMMTEGTSIDLATAISVIEQRFGVTLTAVAANGETITNGEVQDGELQTQAAE